MIVVQNKIDKRKKSLPTKKYRTQFPNIVDFVDVSCADGYEKTIAKLVRSVGQAVSQLPQVGDKLPGEWVSIRKDLQGLDADHITYGQYAEICAKRGLSEEKAKYLSRYLHDLGVIVHYQRDPLLKKMVVVNPDWIVDGVYMVLDAPIVTENHGRFSSKDLAKIWKDDKYANNLPELLGLMKNYELCFELPGTGTFIAPELLAANPVRHIAIKKSGRLTFIYRYEFMPAGLITRLIVKVHRLIDKSSFWKGGVVVKFEGARAAIVEDQTARTICIDIEGDDDSKRDLLAIIRKEFSDIYAVFNRRVEYEELIPCNCDRCVARIEEDKAPHFFGWRTLNRYATSGIVSDRCDLSLVEVNVRTLIGKVAAEPDVWVGDAPAERFDRKATIGSAAEHLPKDGATDETSAPNWQKITAFVTGVVFLITLLIVAIFIPNPSDFQFFVFRVVLALAAGAFGAVIPGFIRANVRNWVRAGGAVALFVIVYFANPPALIANQIAEPEKTPAVKEALPDS